MAETRISVSAVVSATPHAVFEVVTDPGAHVEIDGSGMLEVAANAAPLTAVGDTFVMHMDRAPLGDIPMGKYQVINTVTRLVPDALVEWSVGTEERGTIGHVYGWAIISLEPGSTEITNYCDWSGTPDSYHSRFPIVPVAMLEKSVDNLVALLGR